MILQEVNPQDLNGAVEQLTKSSIEFSEAIANLGALKVMSGVFVVFAIIMILIFVYQVLTTSKKVERVDKSMKRVEQYFETAADKAIGNAQAQVMVRRAFNSLGQNVKYTILRTRLENHIEDKSATTNKIHKLVRYEYSELNSFFANFDYKEKPFATVINHDDAQLIEEFILEQVYFEEKGSTFSVPAMDQAAEILINGLKLEYLKKL